MDVPRDWLIPAESPDRAKEQQQDHQHQNRTESRTVM